MSVLYTPGDTPEDVMSRVANVMDFVSETLCALPPDKGLELSSQALCGLTYITLDCAYALECAAGQQKES